jgi:2-methylcitrate dehydratase PrpD
MNQPHATQTVLEQIAERIVSFDLKAITPQAIMLSRTAIIDTLGVSLAGAARHSHPLPSRLP